MRSHTPERHKSKHQPTVQAAVLMCCGRLRLILLLWLCVCLRLILSILLCWLLPLLDESSVLCGVVGAAVTALHPQHVERGRAMSLAVVTYDLQ